MRGRESESVSHAEARPASAIQFSHFRPPFISTPTLNGTSPDANSTLYSPVARRTGQSYPALLRTHCTRSHVARWASPTESHHNNHHGRDSARARCRPSSSLMRGWRVALAGRMLSCRSCAFRVGPWDCSYRSSGTRRRPCLRSYRRPVHQLVLLRDDGETSRYRRSRRVHRQLLHQPRRR